tara:strand:- start:92 stop:559 length:468 start_codon:yes stop_codon:yes gene_type:complete
MSNKQKGIIALLLLIFSVFGSGLDLSNILPKPEPPNAAILVIETPSKEVLDRVEIFSTIVKNPDDRAKLAIFNYEFADRVSGYNTSSQQVNDVYSFAGKTFFKSDLVDKYDNLAEEIVKLMESVIGVDNHILSKSEKDDLNTYFMGVAWVLINKG